MTPVACKQVVYSGYSCRILGDPVCCGFVFAYGLPWWDSISILSKITTGRLNDSVANTRKTN